jgi:hypothetical protein
VGPRLQQVRVGGCEAGVEEGEGGSRRRGTAVRQEWRSVEVGAGVEPGRGGGGSRPGGGSGAVR